MDVQVLRRQWKFGPEPTEVRRARNWARAQFGACPVLERHRTDTLVLLVSELVTNAVVHTGRPGVVRLVLPGPGDGLPAVRLEVADHSTRLPRRRAARQEATSGRGLELVEILADRWGWQPEGDGKCVWCELDCPVPDGAPVGRKVPARY
ncbi:ATP-binding protein [Streptomyces sodiiphilus]|uniref:ATP-binding protein n=1 Tax=Streptomyces sodiiphilus TaxID=226217 RepID=A0ABN2P5B7_9ACTN